MPPKVHNLFGSSEGETEEIRQLQHGDAFTLEHIVSRGQASDPDFWYDQPREEWVILLRGTASLELKNREILNLKAGDHILIPAHCQHRVASTSPDAHWLALHFDPTPLQ